MGHLARPGDELLIVLMTAPVAIGAVGLIFQPAGKRWGPATFTGLAIGLTLLLLPALLSRIGSGMELWGAAV